MATEYTGVGLLGVAGAGVLLALALGSLVAMLAATRRRVPAILATVAGTVVLGTVAITTQFLLFVHVRLIFLPSISASPVGPGVGLALTAAGAISLLAAGVLVRGLRESLPTVVTTGGIVAIGYPALLLPRLASLVRGWYYLDWYLIGPDEMIFALVCFGVALCLLGILYRLRVSRGPLVSAAIRDKLIRWSVPALTAGWATWLLMFVSPEVRRATLGWSSSTNLAAIGALLLLATFIDRAARRWRFDPGLHGDQDSMFDR